jgi:zinc/manganese transport system permease protein
MNFSDIFFTPFSDFLFMKRALAGILALSLGSAPIGVFLMLRRMSLAGDAIAHAILPGTALAYLFAGLSLSAMTIGGFLAGILIALLAGVVARYSLAKEDTSLAVFYLVSLALGVLLIALRKSPVDLFHILFGNLLALDENALLLIASFSSFSLICLFLGLRVFVLECLDAPFLTRVSVFGQLSYFVFLVLVVLNLMSGFHALGTLLSVGMMIMPAAAARFWVKHIAPLIFVSILIAFLGGNIGLLLSWHFDLASGPAIILVLGGFYFLSLFIAPFGPIISRLRPKKHFQG